jgi:hypothetical protein
MATTMTARAPRFRAGKRLWEPADDERMRREFPDTPSAELAARLGRTRHAVEARATVLGVHKSEAYLASPAACRLRRGDHVGAAYRFKPGQVPPNKGLRRPGYAPGRMRETQFKKGNPARWMPIGSRRLIDGYVYIKLADVRYVPHTHNWFLEHVLDWEIANRRPLPPGHALRFRNGDRTDLRLDNLELVSRGDNMRRNSLHNLPAPLAQTIQLLGALKRQIRRRDHARQEQDSGPA